MLASMAVADKSAYELERDRNLEANKARLVELGLDHHVAEFRRTALIRSPPRAAPKPRQKPRARPAARIGSPRRKSRRLCGVDAPDHGSIDHLDDDAPAAHSLPSPGRREDVKPRWDEWQHIEYDRRVPVSAEERAVLEVPEDWLSDFESFISELTHISTPNFNSVMKQVRKLAAGEVHPPPPCPSLPSPIPPTPLPAPTPTPPNPP